jgi:hypothetical protein
MRGSKPIIENESPPARNALEKAVYDFNAYLRRAGGAECG